jgi:acyl carrier protein
VRSLTPNGKVDRKALANLKAPAVSILPVYGSKGDAIESRIRQIVAEILNLETIDLQRSLLDWGADSLDIVSIFNRLEREFGIRPRIEEFYAQPTIAQLAAAYQPHTHGH